MDTFYFAPGTCSLAVHIALEEAGAPFQAVRVGVKLGNVKLAEMKARADAAEQVAMAETQETVAPKKAARGSAGREN